jgi:hypothetical protein
MNVRWMAVLTGYIVDFVVSQLLLFFASPEFFTSPDLTRTGDLILMCLLTFSTGVGGYIAGRMAGSSRALNGLMVAIIGILVGQLGPPPPRIIVIATVVACGLAALGGYLSRYPTEQASRSSRRR